MEQRNNLEVSTYTYEDVGTEIFELRNKLVSLLDQGKSVVVSGNEYFHNGLLSSSFAEGYFNEYYFLLEDKTDETLEGKTWDSFHLRSYLGGYNSKLRNKETVRRVILTNETMSLEELKVMKHQVIYFKFASETTKNGVEELLFEH